MRRCRKIYVIVVAYSIKTSRKFCTGSRRLALPRRFVPVRREDRKQIPELNGLFTLKRKSQPSGHDLGRRPASLFTTVGSELGGPVCRLEACGFGNDFRRFLERPRAEPRTLRCGARGRAPCRRLGRGMARFNLRRPGHSSAESPGAKSAPRGARADRHGRQAQCPARATERRACARRDQGRGRSRATGAPSIAPGPSARHRSGAGGDLRAPARARRGADAAAPHLPGRRRARPWRISRASNGS